MCGHSLDSSCSSGCSSDSNSLLNGNLLQDRNSSTPSPLMLAGLNQFGLDQLIDGHNDDHTHHHQHLHNHHHHHHHHHKNVPFHSEGPTALGSSPSASLMLVDGCELDVGGVVGDDADDDLHGTLTSFVCTDLGAESDTGYTSGVDCCSGLFNTSSSSLIDCGGSDSNDAYCFRQFSLGDSSLVDGGGGDGGGGSSSGSNNNISLSSGNLLIGNNMGASDINSLSNFNNTDHHHLHNQAATLSNLSTGCGYLDGGGAGSSSSPSSICIAGNYSDMINNNDYYSNYYNDFPQSDMTSQQQQQQQQQQTFNKQQLAAGTFTLNNNNNKTDTEKRSVLMNLLIDGSDIGAGYASINCRALQSRSQQYQYQAYRHYSHHSSQF